MARKHKKIIIELKPKKVAFGHSEHRSGSGQHDRRPKRFRTRAEINKKAIQDSTL